jgi:hypothetical protein
VVDSTEVGSVVVSAGVGSVVVSTGVGSVANSGAVGLVGCAEVLSAQQGCKISLADSKADISTEDFVGLTATSDFMTASAASMDMRAIRTTTISFTAATKCRDHFWRLRVNFGCTVVEHSCCHRLMGYLRPGNLTRRLTRWRRSRGCLIADRQSNAAVSIPLLQFP